METVDQSAGWLRDAASRLAAMDATGALGLIRAAREAGASGALLDAMEARAWAGLSCEDDAARLADRALQDSGLDDEEAIAEARWARGLALARSAPEAARLDLVEALNLRQGAADPDGAPIAADLSVLEAAAGRREEAEILLGDAVDALEGVGDALGVARVLLLAADARRASGDPSSAVDALLDADARLTGCKEESLLVQLWWRQAEVALDLGDAHQGLLFARRALSRAGGAHDHVRGRVWGTVARAHEAGGDVPSALGAWRRSAELLATSAGGLDARAEEAALAAAAGRLEDLRDRLGPWAEQASQRPGDTAAVRFHALGLALAAADGDRTAWSHHWRQVALAATDDRQLSPRLAQHLHLAASQRGEWPDDLEHAEHPLSRVVRAEALALEVWNRLGRTTEAVREARALHELGAKGAPIPAGPFDLLRRIGRGAVGEVWRARHHDRRLVVAVKVLAQADPRLRDLFRSEVKAAASLDHPNIVRVLGTGVLGPESEAVAHGQVRSESPWFAMELADGGTLDPWCGRLVWSQCRAVLVSLLDALAHAHARGVVHLDLKPSNVLLRPAQGGVLLSDFGLAKVVDLQHRKSTVAGTPQYMAPEQFRGDARDYGPWTDLYALGCLAVQLVSGEPPFPGGTLEEQRAAHLEAPLPPIRPRVAVPLGLDGWIGRLLEKDPADRFQRAADAAFALAHLVDPPDGPVPDELPRPAFRPRSWSLSVNSVEDATHDDPGEATLPAPVGAERARPGQRPPCPDDWRSVVEVPPLDDFADVALSLVGLRRPPLVGREAERDELWTHLVAVAWGRGTEVLVLRGPPGCGKSALARWLCERAHELGAATVLDAAPGPDGRSGLQAIVARHLRLEGLEADDARRRIRLAFPDLPSPVVEDLAILVVEHGVALSAVERVSSVVAFAARLASGRPVIVRLGSVGPGAPEPVLLARMLRASGAPVLVLLEEEGTPLEIEGASTLDIEPMSEEDLLALLDALVPLDPMVRAQLGELCGDNPDLLLRSLTGLVQGDAFQRGAEGWRLRPGVKLALPPEVAATWAERVVSVMAGMDPAARTALAGAACLGRALNAERFGLVCAAAGTTPAAVIDGSAGLLRAPRDRPPRFEHPAVPAVLREDFADLAVAQAAAVALEHARGAEAEYATLLLQAGRLAEAVEPLLRGAEACLRDGDAARAADLLDRRARIRSGLVGAEGAADLDEALLRARIAQQAGSPEAEALAATAVELAERASEPLAVAEALLVKARETWRHGDQERAQGELRRAVDAFATAGDLSGTGRALREAGDLAASVGDLTSALSLHNRAVQRLAEGDPLDRAAARAALAETWRQWGEIARAEQELTAATAEAGEAPSATRAEVLRGWGDVCRTAGRHDEAEGWYRAVLTSLPWHDAGRVREVQLRRAYLRVALGRLNEARALVDGLLGSAADGGPFAGRCRLVELVVVARSDDRTWSARLESVRPWMELCDRDVAWLLDQAGRRTAAAGRTDRSLLLFGASAAIYRKMNLAIDHAAVERRAATLRRAR